MENWIYYRKHEIFAAINNRPTILFWIMNELTSQPELKLSETYKHKNKGNHKNQQILHMTSVPTKDIHVVAPDHAVHLPARDRVVHNMPCLLLKKIP